MIKSKEEENDELYDNLLLFKDNILNYLQKEKEKLIEADIFLNIKQIRDLRQENNKLLKAKEEVNKLKLEENKLENKINALETLINKHETTLKTHEASLKTHEATLKTHEDTLKTHETTINELKGKVEFMEPIVLSLISTKAINHSIIKILENVPLFTDIANELQITTNQYIDITTQYTTE